MNDGHSYKLRVALFPGTFRPWHKGHTAILLAACKAFDQVVIGVLQNPEKKNKGRVPKLILDKLKPQVLVVNHDGMLRELVRKTKVDAIIRGMRSPSDFEYERSSQYWNEDLGIDVPFFYVISPRELVHVSSTATRMVAKLLGGSKKK